MAKKTRCVPTSCIKKSCKGRKRKSGCRPAKGPGPCVKTKLCNGRRVCAQRGYGPALPRGWHAAQRRARIDDADRHLPAQMDGPRRRRRAR